MSNDKMTIEEAIYIHASVPPKKTWVSADGQRHWAGPGSETLALIGPPGLGKTWRSNQASTALGAVFCPFIASSKLPEDLSGTPVASEGLYMVKKLPSFMKTLNDAHAAGRPSVFFGDEFLHAPDAVKAPMLSIIQERRMDDIWLPDTTAIVLAWNDLEDGGGENITPAMANRLSHMRVNFSIQEWLAHWMSGGSATEAEPGSKAAYYQMARDNFPTAYPYWHGLLAGFGQARRKDGVYNQPTDPRKARGPWPSARSTEAAMRLAATAEAIGFEDYTADLLEIRCGLEWTTELLQYKASADLPNPNDVLDGKADFKPSPARVDIMAAVGSALAQALLANVTKERVSVFWDMHHKIVVDGGGGDVADNMMIAVTLSRNPVINLHPKATKAQTASAALRAKVRK